jgi:hypothetical protein
MIDKQYDILIVHLVNKIKHYYFSGLADMLIPIGAANTTPTVDDIEYAALVAAMFLLHTCEVDLETDLADISEAKVDVLAALNSFESLKDQLKDFKRRHNESMEDKLLKEALIKSKTTAEA